MLLKIKMFRQLVSTEQNEKGCSSVGNASGVPEVS